MARPFSIPEKIDITVSPELAAHSDDITLNADLYARVKAVYEKRDNLGLNSEQYRLLEETNKGFVRSGANLDAKSQEVWPEILEIRASILDGSLEVPFDTEL